ncbi:DNA repair protein RadA [Gloeobacter kilaueensis]|uniref:DNA repair protein RadA n=1 Tax=Gloeobacter kilaueensis (strain ATCC BAA-2537 / CCAP 1431/1 / ULC 316 / JS1) TaxID=1183438 RepID=U5QFV9_GLOK1|nr:DNA repair protein RadA [Gloeobacter kilaueensis]AGY57822.1 DNA repair protein RadA [Gloeobacter kilaueensis JS1]
MAKTRTQFTCTQCGYESVRWLGRCPGCDAWDSFIEETIAPAAAASRVPAAAQAAPRPRAAIALTALDQHSQSRISSGFAEFDRVLGGGIVTGSLVLIGGDPGIGKSTLLLQAACRLAQAQPVLYVSAEESAQQVKLRAERLELAASGLYLLAETELETILAELESLQPAIAVIDSIQAVYLSALSAAAGSVSQVRECTAALMRLAKRTQTSLFIVGHVTKEGALAGPKVLEHLVDTVLYFEGDRFQSHRLLRSVKNRFGATHEIGVFEMMGQGLAEVENPSELFLSGQDEPAPGTATIVACEGTRPLVVELQSLVSPTSYGSPRRTTTGIEYNRFLQILAVLEKRVGIPLSRLDAYVASVGGLDVSEPAADLGVAVAVAASFRDRIVDPQLIILGEVGLGGQVRPISQLELRLKEAAKLGFKRAIVPRGSAHCAIDMEIIPVARVLDALVAALGGPVQSPPDQPGDE